MLHSYRVSILGLLVFLSTAPNARAAIQTFFGLDNPRGTLTNSLGAESNFKAALSSFGTDNVDTFADGTPNPLLVFGLTGVTGAAANTVVQNDTTFGTPVSAPNQLEDDFGNEVFTFSVPVNGFGTFLLGAGNASTTTNTITFLLENTLLATSQSVMVNTFGPSFPATNAAYFGVIDAASPFNRVTVQASDNNDTFNFDNLTVGFAPASAAVPELGAFATWAGLCVAGALVARRRLR